MGQFELAGFAFLVAVLISAATTYALIQIAPRIGAVDLPGPRKVHSRPIPRIGGVGVFAGVAVSVFLVGTLSGRQFLNVRDLDVLWIVVAAAGFGMFLMGVADDLRGLSFKSKFAVQILAAVSVWLAGFRIEVLTHPLSDGNLELGALSLPITVLWVVGITNAINLIDGLDGLAAGAALIMTCAVACIAFFQGHLGVVAMSVAIVGALLGFLVFNFNPARIFLGDSGSMFIGFTLAVISIRGSQKGATAVAAVAPLLLLGLPILDTSLAVVRRFLRLVRTTPADGRGRLAHVARNAHHVFLPDREHLHHQLLDLGLGHRGAVLTLYGVVALMAATGLGVVLSNSLLVAGILIGSLVVATAGLVVALRLRVLRRRRAAEESGTVAVADLAAAGRSSD